MNKEFTSDFEIARTIKVVDEFLSNNNNNIVKNELANKIARYMENAYQLNIHKNQIAQDISTLDVNNIPNEVFYLIYQYKNKEDKTIFKDRTALTTQGFKRRYSKSGYAPVNETLSLLQMIYLNSYKNEYNEKQIEVKHVQGLDIRYIQKKVSAFFVELELAYNQLKAYCASQNSNVKQELIEYVNQQIKIGISTIKDFEQGIKYIFQKNNIGLKYNIDCFHIQDSWVVCISCIDINGNLITLNRYI